MPDESAFTEAHIDCPHPERWTAVDVDATELEVTALVQSMIVALQPEIVVETGTYSAQTSLAIAQALLANGHGRLWTFEIDADRHAAAVEKLAGLPAAAMFGPIQEWTPPGPVDFAWIDSGNAAVRRAEIRWLSKYAHQRTIAGVHDTSYASVQEALRDLTMEHTITYPLFLPTPRGVAFARFPGALHGR